MNEAVLLALLELHAASEVGPALSAALEALAAATRAGGAYLEVDGEGVSSVHSVGLDERGVELARIAVSRGIVAEALVSGRSVVTRSATTDPRFSARESVQRHAIEQVLCAPLGDPPRGAIYLERSASGAGFGDTERVLVEQFARYVAPAVDRLALLRRLDDREDATRPWRARLRCEELVGRGVALARLLREVDEAAPTDLSVLLLGPSGTGKSLVARVLHRSSARQAGPFVVVDCPSIPDTLFEAELFGAESGAFTGATQRRGGLVRAAAGGTLFLDEVGELSTANQAKLLHFLETREIRRLGSDRSERADVRIVAATNRDLERESGFRADLYWRLAGFPIAVPGLDARAEDLPVLARELVRRAAEGQRTAIPELGPAAVRAILARQWPGNVRELQNTLQRGVARSAREGSRVLEPRHLFPDADDVGEAATFQEQTRRFQADLLRSTLEATRWNVSEAARRLDLARSHVYTLIRAFGISQP